MNINLGGNKSSITINGKTYTGNSVEISGGKVLIDGKEQDGELTRQVKVEIVGNVESVEAGSGDVVVKGSCGQVKTTNGDVECGNVEGNVSTTNGDVSCKKVAGSVSTVNGDICRRLL